MTEIFMTAADHHSVRRGGGGIGRIAAVLVALLAPLAAQEPGPGEIGEIGAPIELPPPGARLLRLLPLGDSPPFRQEVRDGVRFELEPPPGSVPPRQLLWGDAESPRAVRLNLGQVSEPVPIPAGAVPFTLREPVPADGPAEAAPPWARITLPESGNVLVLLWRDAAAPWSRPRSMLLPEAATTFPAGSLRLVNLTATTIAVVLGAERTALTPGQVVVKPLATGSDVPLQLAYSDAAGNVRRFHSTTVMLNEGERGQIFIHRADGERPRQPVKVVTLSERAPAP